MNIAGSESVDTADKKFSITRSIGRLAWMLCCILLILVLGSSAILFLAVCSIFDSEAANATAEKWGLDLKNLLVRLIT